MAVRLELVEGRKQKSEDFEAEYSRVCDHLYFQCLDDRGDPQGYAVAEVVKKFRSDGDGAFLLLRYVQVSDPYYQHWLETSGGGNFFHHLCCSGLSACQRKVGRDSLVHIQHWLAVGAHQVASIVRGWKTSPLNFGTPKAPRGRSLVEEPVQTAAKAKASHRGHRDGRTLEDSPGDGQGDRGGRRRAHKEESEEDSEEDDDVGRSNARRHRRRRSSRSPRCRPEEARGSVGHQARGKRRSAPAKSSPLDAMLGDDETDPLYGDQRLEELRKKLETHKKKAEAKGSASEVLVQRVQAGLEKGQKRKKESEKDKVVKALKILRGNKSADESSSSDERSEEDLLPKGDNMTDRQRKLRKLSAEHPGTLLVRVYNLMHDQLGTLYGEAAGGGSPEALQPAALRYLLTSAIPQMDPQLVGEERLRELRTVASVLDMIVSGRILGAGDMLAQRFKAVLMSIRDQSTAASKYLELIPVELQATASTVEEADYARSMAVRSAKSQELLKKARTAVG